MFSYRLLLRNTLITTDKLSASYKCTTSGKSPNVIKTFNTENKNLFGSLLESKTQRRKNESKASVVTKPSATTNQALVHNEAPKKKSRTKKSKDIETLTVVLSDNSVSNSSLMNNSCEDDLKSDVSNNTFSEANSQKSNSSKTGMDSLKNLSLVDTQNEESSTILSDKFILHSAVAVDENSYPLDNPNKLELSTNSGSLENVLNYGFTDPLVKDYMRFPSVSKIMEDTMSPMSRMVLSKWRKNMIADLGEEGFAKHCTGLKSTPEKLLRGFSSLPFATSDTIKKKKRQSKVKSKVKENFNK